MLAAYLGGNQLTIGQTSKKNIQKNTKKGRFIGKQAVAVAKTAITEIQSETSVAEAEEEEEAVKDEDKKDEEADGEKDKLRKAALDKLENASQDSFLGQVCFHSLIFFNMFNAGGMCWCRIVACVLMLYCSGWSITTLSKCICIRLPNLHLNAS